MIERLVIAAPDGWDSPSARYRLGPIGRVGSWGADAVATGTFPEDDRISGLIELAGPDALLVLQRVLPHPKQLERLRDAFPHVVYDIDDAIYTVPPDIQSSWLAKAPKLAARALVRGSPYASSRKRPLERILPRVDACVVGNSILGDFVRRHTDVVIEIPTTVTPLPQPPEARPRRPVVVWHGLQGNLQYLDLTREALARLAGELDFDLRIIASSTWEDAPVPVEFVRWSPEAQHQGLLTASVGLAPMADEPWTRGKCAFRSVQYGGYALPTVASPVGITDRVIRDGETGFLARSTTDWVEALRALLTDLGLASRLGEAARRHIQENYSDELAVERWRTLIGILDGDPPAPAEYARHSWASGRR